MPTTVQIAGVDGPIDVRVDDSHCTLDGTMQVGIVDLSAEMTRYVVVATHIGDSWDLGGSWVVSVPNLRGKISLPALPQLDGWYAGYLAEFCEGRWNTASVLGYALTYIHQMFVQRADLDAADHSDGGA
ncbi:MAG: hypothetical protein KDH16_22765 [Rhodocyclaceae bacterium]|nr:hypothetical protein [Rhodocyclaceae bacterium]